MPRGAVASTASATSQPKSSDERQPPTASSAASIADSNMITVTVGNVLDAGVTQHVVHRIGEGRWQDRVHPHVSGSYAWLCGVFGADPGAPGHSTRRDKPRE